MAALGTLAAVAPTANAGVSETPNACKFSYDGEYRTQGVKVTATAPASVAPGQQFTLDGEQLEVKLRTELASDAAQVGLLPSSAEGTESTVVTKTWFALRGTNTKEGTQVIGPITVNATTKAYNDEAGQRIYADPWVYTPPALPDTTWTATGGDISFSEGGPNSIDAAKGQLPVGGGGSPMTVVGATVVQATLPGTPPANFYMDCVPGNTIVTRPQAGAGVSFSPLAATPFAGVSVTGPPSNPGGDPPGGGGGGGGTPGAVAGKITTTSLKASKAGKVKLSISCKTATAACEGAVRLRTKSKLKIGKRKAKIVNLARDLGFAVAKGKTKTVTLTLSKDAKSLLRTRKSIKTTLTLKPVKGTAATRTLNLRKG